MKKLPRFLKRKRTWLVLGVICICTALGCVGFFGNSNWQRTFDTTDRRLNTVKAQVKMVFGADTKRDARLAAVSKLAGLKNDETCSGEWWNEWQRTAFAPTRKALERCQKQEQTIRSVADAAKAVDRHIVAEKRITEQIANLKVDTTAKNWQETALASAQSVRTKLDDIESMNSIEPVLKASKERTDIVITAWNQLNEASKKQDKAAYIVAETQLRSAYANLAAIADVSDAQLAGVVATLHKTTDNL